MVSSEHHTQNTIKSDTIKTHTLRSVEKIHINQMVDIFCHGQTYHYTEFPEIFCPPDDHEAIGAYLSSYLAPRNPLRTRRHFGLVWTEQDKVLGYLVYQLYQSSSVFFGKDRWTCFVDDIAVHPDRQSEGIASHLMQSLITEANKKQNCLLMGQIWHGNTGSQALFEKFGFAKHAGNFYRVNS